MSTGEGKGKHKSKTAINAKEPVRNFNPAREPSKWPQGRVSNG